MYQLKSETFQRFCCFLIPLAALLSGGTEVCAGDDTNGEIEIVIDFDGNGTVAEKSEKEEKKPAPKPVAKPKPAPAVQENNKPREIAEVNSEKEKEKEKEKAVQSGNQVSHEELEKKDPELLRNNFIKNCNQRATQNNENVKVKLIKCSIKKNEIFQIFYDLSIEPDVSYERGKNLPLYRHYPRMRSAICETVDDLSDAGFVAVRVMYQYKGKIIQSNYLDLNDCFLAR
jgi:hypothetical protein